MGGEFHFSKARRLIQKEVEELLRAGKRLSRDALGVRLLENNRALGRIAIAVPKRIFKRAVDRNRIKRVIREEFRHHEVRRCSVDLLITLRSALKPTVGSVQENGKSGNRHLRETSALLFEDVARRFGHGK
jgi:ribonuclease P protein component